MIRNIGNRNWDKFVKAFCKAFAESKIVSDTLQISSGQSFDNNAADMDDMLDFEDIEIRFKTVQLANSELFWDKVKRYMVELN